MKFHDGLLFCHFSGDACLHSRIWKELQVRQNTSIVQVFDRKLNVLMYQLVLSEVNILLELQWWKTSVLAGITLQLELHKLRRPTQDDNETTVVNKNDTMFYFVLAFCQEGRYLFDSYIPVRSCLSIAASVPWSLFLFRILLIGHCFWNIPIRNLRSVLFFFSAHFWRNDFLCLGPGQKRCRSRPGTRSHVATRQPSNPYASYGDMIYVDYDLAYDFDTCPQAM